MSQYPRKPSPTPAPPPQVTLAEVTFHLFLAKFNQPFTGGSRTRQGARQLGWASFPASAGRATRASGTTFLHINNFARLTETILGVASVTKCLALGFKAEICFKEMKINSAKAALIE